MLNKLHESLYPVNLMLNKHTNIGIIYNKCNIIIIIIMYNSYNCDLVNVSKIAQ